MVRLESRITLCNEFFPAGKTARRTTPKFSSRHERVRKMSCCSKARFVVGAAVVGIGVALVASTGVATAVWHRAVAKIEKQIPPEVQIEQIKIDIDKLDGDIDRNWSPI